MSSELIQTRWFWPWQDEEEEAWLHDMAGLGYHLVQADLGGRYHFDRGEPRNDFYRLDFQTGRQKDRPAYEQLFKDSGWEWVTDLGGWRYFRKTVPVGESPEIFTDQSSKIEKYRRVLGFLLLVFIACLLATNTVWQGHSPAMWIVRAVVLALVVFYIFLFVKLFQRIAHLSRKL